MACQIRVDSSSSAPCCCSARLPEQMCKSAVGCHFHVHSSAALTHILPVPQPWPQQRNHPLETKPRSEAFANVTFYFTKMTMRQSAPSEAHVGDDNGQWTAKRILSRLPSPGSTTLSFCCSMWRGKAGGSWPCRRMGRFDDYSDPARSFRNTRHSCLTG
jgi:hypothetical protein